MVSQLQSSAAERPDHCHLFLFFRNSLTYHSEFVSCSAVPQAATFLLAKLSSCSAVPQAATRSLFLLLFNRRPHSCFRDAEIATTSRAISPESWHCPVFCVEHAPHQTAGSPAEVCVNGCVLSSSGFYGCGSSNSGSASSSSHSIPRDKWRLRWPCSDVRGWG